MTPAWITSTARRRPGSALPWLPICVASFLYSPIPDNAGFLDGLNERFWRNSVAHLHARIAATRGVGPGGNRYRVDFVPDLVEHLPVILVFLDVRELFAELSGLFVQGVLVDIAQRDQGATATGSIRGVAVAFAADADAGDADLAVGAQHTADIREREARNAGGQGGATEELTSRE